LDYRVFLGEVRTQVAKKYPKLEIAIESPEILLWLIGKKTKRIIVNTGNKNNYTAKKLVFFSRV